MNAKNPTFQYSIIPFTHCSISNVPLSGRVQDEEAGGFDFDRLDFSAPGVGLHLGLFQRHHRSVPKMFDRLFG
jgi:hypothetical protein